MNEPNDRNNCLASNRLTLPTAPPPPPPPPRAYKLLVVTAGDPTAEPTASGLAAINAVAAAKNVEVAVASTLTQIQVEFGRLADYRAVVFLNTGMASPLNDAQRANFEAYFKKGGGFVGIGSAIETDPSWPFLTELLGTRAVGPDRRRRPATVKVSDRVHDATKNLPEYWDRTDDFYNFTTQRPRRLARARDGRRGSVRAAAAGQRARRHRRRHDGRRPPGLLVQGLPGRPLLLHRRSATRPRRFDADLHAAPQGRDQLGRGPERPGLQRLRRDRADELPADQGLRAAEPQRADRLRPAPDGRIIQTARRGDVRLHDPATGTTQVIADFGDPALPQTHARLHQLRGRPLRPGGRQRTSPPTSGCTSTTRRRRSRTSSCPTARSSRRPRRTTTVAELRAVARRRGTRTSATSSSRASSSSRTPPARALTSSSEQQILRVSNNRQECCHVAGDIDFDKHNNLWMVTGDDTPAGGINAGGYGPFKDQLTDEQQTVRVTNATGGTFTLTFNGQTTAPLAVQRDRARRSTPRSRRSRTSAPTTSRPAAARPTRRTSTCSSAARWQQTDQPQITANGAGLTGTTTPTRARNDAPAPGGRLVPAPDRRRPPLDAEHQRPARQDPAHQGQGQHHRRRRQQGRLLGTGTGAYTIPAGQPVTRSSAGAPQAQDPARDLRDGLPQPVPDPGRRERRRLRHRLLAGRQHAAAQPRPGRRRPLRDRAQAGQLRLSALLHDASSATTSGTSTSSRPARPRSARRATTRRSRSTAATRPLRERLALGASTAARPSSPASPTCRRSPIRTSGTPTATTTPTRRSARRASATTRRRPGPIAPGSTTECPRLFPELYTGGVGPHGAAKYHYDPANPNTDEVPAVLRRLGRSSASSRQDTLREVKLDAQNRIFKINSFLDCGAGATSPTSTFPFECDNPMDMQFGADGAFYLLTYGDGFFAINPDAGMYRWEYVKGQRAPKAVLTTDKTDGALPLTVHFSSAGSQRRRTRATRSATSGTSATASPISTEPEPDARLHAGRPLHGRADGDRLVGQDDLDEHDRSRRATPRRRSPSTRRSTAALFAFGDKHPVQGHRHRPRGRRRSTATTSR